MNHYLSQSPTVSNIAFHILRLSLSNTYVLYTIKLSFEGRLILDVGLSTHLSICLLICSFFICNYTFI